MSIFKKCTSCGYEWDKREELLSAPSIRMVGYQVNTKQLMRGLILFNHKCTSTIAVTVWRFRDLYSGPVYSDFKFGKEECPAYCSDENNLQPCNVKCHGAFVREILQIIEFWPKQNRLAKIAFKSN